MVSLCWERSLYAKAKNNVIAFLQNGKFCVVEFLSCLSFSWIPCLLQIFSPLLYSSWIIKKCCDSQYDCESGAAALNCAVTFACFSHSLRCSTLSFLVLSHLVHKPEHDASVLRTPKSHLEGGQGVSGGVWVLRWWWRRSLVCPRLQSENYSSESVFRSGCFLQGRGKGGRDIFLSHHAPAAGPKLAQRVGQFLQG